MEAESNVVDLLLKRGVKVQVTAPLFFFFKRKKTLTVTVPTCETLLGIAGEYAKIKQHQEDITLHQAMDLVLSDTVRVSRIVAMAVRNNPYQLRKTVRLAKALRASLSQEEVSYLFSLIMTQGGVSDFIATIRFIGKTRITQPMMMSPTEETS
ncbi:MAG: hypothetical protein Q4G08_04205 [Capnocytophaga sp.]|nr:hypothetical protein [Capnocytophaga sp.]